MVYQQQLHYSTRGRGTHEITAEVQQHIESSGVRNGICTVFIHHTSASLIITENADATPFSF